MFIDSHSLFSGLNRVRIEGPFVYHLKHEERWDIERWARFGAVGVDLLIKQNKKSSQAADYKRRFNSEVKRRLFAGFNKKTLRNILEAAGVLEDRDRLDFFKRFSDLNVEMIGGW